MMAFGETALRATLQSPNGSTLQVVTLKAQGQPSWDNNKTNTVLHDLNPPLSASEIAQVVITLTSHNSGQEMDDI
jgi:hypothetical protein